MDYIFSFLHIPTVWLFWSFSNLKSWIRHWRRLKPKQTLVLKSIKMFGYLYPLRKQGIVYLLWRRCFFFIICYGPLPVKHFHWIIRTMFGFDNMISIFVHYSRAVSATLLFSFFVWLCTYKYFVFQITTNYLCSIYKWLLFVNNLITHSFILSSKIKGFFPYFCFIYCSHRSK